MMRGIFLTATGKRAWPCGNFVWPADAADSIFFGAMSETNNLMSVRLEKRAELEAAGKQPYGCAFRVDGDVGEVRAGFSEGAKVSVAGRVTARRDMGKSHFLDVSDHSGRLQIYLQDKVVGDEGVALYEKLDIGDFIGVEGECFTTKTGEPSVKAERFVLLSKSLRPLPEKWHGLQDVEARHRQRYLDLISNPESRDIFRKRFAIIREIRSFFEERGFLEVETPMMQAVAGGAAAQPFETHHNALGLDLYLRIAPELYLKRLLVGGFTKVFELNRNFRNEGVSRRHNPEFTMLEAYWAYADFDLMAGLVEDLVCRVAEKVCGGLRIEHKDAGGEVTRVINLARPWRRARYRVLVEEAEPGWFARDVSGRRNRAVELGLDISQCVEDHEVTQHVFEKLVEEKSIDPLFVTHCPQELIPLAKANPGDPTVLDVFELVMNGQEIAPGYSELNDPVVQRQRLTEQSGGEQHKIDEEFLHALEYGMPPAGGMGMGIDRLVMLLTGAESIREVILFPHLKPR
ncbi:MAG: lysine--tRNA ligase [Chthoniobacterales bacterium]|jgi:lysyl-tRNA synthetase class 2